MRYVVYQWSNSANGFVSTGWDFATPEDAHDYGRANFPVSGYTVISHHYVR